MASDSKVLILFDVNGVMCARVKAEDQARIDPAHFVPTNPRYDVVINPHIREIILELAEQYTVGIYSSTKHHNLMKSVRSIFGPTHPFRIIADRTITPLHPGFGTDPSVEPHQTIKPLTAIWNNAVFNEDRVWNTDNTILIDHDRQKLSINPPSNCLLLPEFTLDSYLGVDPEYTPEKIRAAIYAHPFLMADFV